MGLPMDKSYLLTQLRNFKSIILDPAYIIQKTTLPTATVDLEGVVYQYIGNSSSLTLGGFYQCQSDGAVSPTYSWVEIPVKIDTDGTTVLKNANGELYVPTATASALGLVKAGDGTAMNDGALDVVDRIKMVSLMPAASASLVGTAVMFLGTTGTYTRGSIYECVSDGESTPTYSWEILLNSDSAAEIANEAATRSALGAKNLLSYPYVDTTKEINGITFTDNGDGTITANGTASGIAQFYCKTRLSNNYYLPVGEYIVSGCPEGGGNSTFVVQVVHTEDSSAVTDATDTGSGASFTRTSADFPTGILISVANGVTLDNLVFKPMIRLATDINSTYQPYAKTNLELTNEIQTKAEQDDLENEVITRSILGAHNLLPFPYYETRTEINSVAITQHANGSITFNGTASAKIYFNCTWTEGSFYYDFGELGFNSKIPTPNAAYIATLENGTDDIFLSYNPINKITSINIESGTVCDNLTVYPMIRLATDTDDTYRQYTKTNLELTQEASTLNEDLYGITTDSDVYTIRQGKGNLADMSLTGGTVAWNQVYPKHTAVTDQISGLTISVDSDGYVSITGTASETKQFTITPYSKTIPANHVCLMLCEGWNGFTWRRGGFTEVAQDYYLNKHSVDFDASARIHFTSGETYNIKTRFCSIDLTQMFGSTIADYIYDLEQANEGDGVAWFRQYFPNCYYSYNEGELKNVSINGRKVTGFNLWDEKWEQGIINENTGNPATGTGLRSKNYINLSPGAYNITWNKTKFGTNCYLMFYDLNGTFLSATYRSAVTDFNVSIPCKMKFYVWSNSMTYDYDQDICVNISDTSKNGTYEPYNATTYSFAPVELRGMPILVDNKLSYNGDRYYSNGSITRKYDIVDLGTLNWNKVSTTGTHWEFIATSLSTVAKFPSAPDTITHSIICSKYIEITASEAYQGTKTGIAMNSSAYNQVLICDENYEDVASFKAAISGQYLVYELKTSIPREAATFANPQRSSLEGIEEFITDEDVLIPVGHETTYYLDKLAPQFTTYADAVGDSKVSYKDNGILGAKNLLQSLTFQQIKASNSAYTWTDNVGVSTAGITVTVNSDNTFTLSGTATSRSVFSIISTSKKAWLNDLWGKELILSGSIPGVQLNIWNSTISQYYANSIDGNESPVFSIPQTTNTVFMEIVVNNGTTVNGTVKPMLRLATDTDATWQPYAMTNQELTNGVDITVLETATDSGPSFNLTVYKCGQLKLVSILGQSVSTAHTNGLLCTLTNKPTIVANIPCYYVDRTSSKDVNGWITIGTEGKVTLRDASFNTCANNVDYIRAQGWYF